ncbi:hypothetical protein I7I48_02591 [Histoplasma ohiense]|nr:hypothetical protein I7I48_02591 [Histoplasma ohiense (nom. inval.)]
MRRCFTRKMKKKTIESSRKVHDSQLAYHLINNDIYKKRYGRPWVSIRISNTGQNTNWIAKECKNKLHGENCNREIPRSPFHSSCVTAMSKTSTLPFPFVSPPTNSLSPLNAPGSANPITSHSSTFSTSCTSTCSK